MKEQVTQALQSVCKDVFGDDVAVELERTDEQYGDYTTTVALAAARQRGRNPRELAQQLADTLNDKHASLLHAEIAGPGYVNIRVNDDILLHEQGRMRDGYGKHAYYKGQTVVVEYADPNPFKILHAGHLYTTIVGDAIANLVEYGSGNVHAVNFGGDVGLHVGRTMWAILQKLGGEHPERLEDIDQNNRAQWLAEAYVMGTGQFEADQDAKAAMIALNKRIYEIHDQRDHDSPLARIYWTCRQWSYDHFDAFYDRIGSRFVAEKQAGNKYYYPESEVAQLGLETVQSHVGSIFTESEGAIVFEGERYGLHTRVFVNSQGIPTYETKDVGLILQKKRDFNFDRSIVITGNEQQQYMQVVLKAIEQFDPEIVRATTHLTHGLVKLAGGEKMSSRRGNILRADDVIEAAAAANQKRGNQSNETVTLGAVKYALLRQRLGGDIIYDPDESVSLQGNSGPYLQYAYVRARKIIDGAVIQPVSGPLEAGERSLLRKLTEFPEVVERSAIELAPHYLATYLYDLAQVFNRFYENSRVRGHAREVTRLGLVAAYASVLQGGLSILGIGTPESM